MPTLPEHNATIVEEAVNFPHDGLFVEYAVELPENVKALQESQVLGRTQLCNTADSATVCDVSQLCFYMKLFQGDVARFSFPIELTLEYSPSIPLASSGSGFWPRLLLRVVSEDYWQRHYVDGYGSVALPIQAGHQRVSVDCWRPVNPQSNSSKTRELFLGQAVDLSSLSDIGISGTASQLVRPYICDLKENS